MRLDPSRSTALDDNASTTLRDQHAKKNCCFTLVLALAPFALGVGTSHWTQTTEADFKAGTFDNVVATNLGDLKLSRATQTLLVAGCARQRGLFDGGNGGWLDLRRHRAAGRRCCGE